MHLQLKTLHPMTFLIAFLVSFILFSCSSFKSYKLSDGRTVLVLRNIEDVYPIYAATYKAELDMALKLKEEVIDTNIGGKYEKDIKSLYENLDNANMHVRNTLITGYSTFIASLSDAVSESEREKAKARWDYIQKEILKLSFELRKFNKQTVSAKTRISSTEWEKLLSKGNKIITAAKSIK